MLADVRDAHARSHLDAQAGQLLLGLGGKNRRVGWQDAGQSFEEEDTSLRRIHVSEVVREGVV